MKTLIILALLITIFGCSGTITTERNLLSPYKVEKIKTIGSDINCLYYLSTGAFYTQRQNNLVVKDSIGKFNINDTIYVTLIKK